MDTSILDRAICFAVKAHNGLERRGKGFPYIVHPMEAMSIVATITNDQELLAAAVLHDTVEDTSVTVLDIEREFGKRVAKIVEEETDKLVEGKDNEKSWHERKKAAIERLKNASLEVKTVALGDKLSNMRAISRDYAVLKDKLWERFHTTDPEEHKWHYVGLLDALSELSGTEAYKEFCTLIEKTFAPSNNAFSISEDGNTIFVSGAIGREEALKITALLGKSEKVLDFGKVTKVNFGALRVLLNSRNDGAVCHISNASREVCEIFDTTGVSKYISVCKKPCDFDMSTVTKFGGGFFSVSYYGVDNDFMMKIYDESMPQAHTEKEKRYAQAAMFAGIPTPLSGDIIKVGEKKGIVFERIMNKKSVARAIADDTENIEEYTRKFAELCKKLHSTPCDKNVFPSWVENFRKIINESKHYNQADKQKMLDFLESVPKSDNCLHGDLHMGNVIFADGQGIFIDMGDFGYGNAYFDLARMYFECHYDGDEQVEELYHVSGDTIRRFWKLFVLYYFGTDDKEEVAKIEADILPFVGLDTLRYFDIIEEKLAREIIDKTLLNRK